MKTIIFLSLLIFQQPKEYHGTVAWVIDGDTFILETTSGRLKIRLEGIDCPEQFQAFGKESKKFLMKYKDRDCKVTWYKTDLYGRTLGTLYVDGKNINLELVKNGLAWHYKRFSDDIELACAENAAKQQKIGLWGEEHTPPWEWRKRSFD